MRNKVLVALMSALVIVACGKKEAAHPGHVEGEAPHAEAPSHATPAPAPEPVPAVPTAQHGGQIVSMGTHHLEVVTGDEIEAYFYDATGKPMAPPAEGKLHISMADGHRSTIPMEIHGEHITTGEALKKAHAHRPFDAAIAVTLGGEQVNFRFTVPK